MSVCVCARELEGETEFERTEPTDKNQMGWYICLNIKSAKHRPLTKVQTCIVMSTSSMLKFRRKISLHFSVLIRHTFFNSLFHRLFLPSPFCSNFAILSYSLLQRACIRSALIIHSKINCTIMPQLFVFIFFSVPFVFLVIFRLVCCWWCGHRQSFHNSIWSRCNMQYHSLAVCGHVYVEMQQISLNISFSILFHSHKRKKLILTKL